MNPGTASLEQLYAERDRLKKLAKVREDRSAEFMAKSVAELDKMEIVQARLSVTEQAIVEKLNGLAMAGKAKRSESVEDALRGAVAK